MSEKDEWISAASAVALLGESALCRRADAGLIKARADRFIGHGQSADNVDVPAGFWWAVQHAAVSKDWTMGDFDTFVAASEDRSKAYGVTFRRSDIERSKPPVAENSSSHGWTPPRAFEERKQTTTGEKVFIGHGRSLVWRELKDFLEDRLHLTTDEFNSVSTAGIATANRLAEMLDAAAFAFLIMTAEDERPDGKFNPRLNVIHEAGLFQGRLGFKKAIVLVEEGCEEFSNIHGFGQIRFPKGNISAKFEEVRQVLERESVIAPR